MKISVTAYIFAAFVMLIGVGLLVPTKSANIAFAEDFKTAKSEYESAKKDRMRTAMSRALQKMGSSNDPKAAKYMLKELKNDQKARAKGREALPGEVRKSLISALSNFTDEDVVKEIGETALDLNSAKSPELALDQFDFFFALAQMDGVAAADEALREAISDKKNPYVKVAAIEAVRQAGAKRFIGDVCNVLREDNKEWRTKWHIVPINVFACLKDIVDESDEDSLYDAVEAAIAWEESNPQNNNRVYYFAYMMLLELTGEEAGLYKSAAFWKWWVVQMKAVGAASARDNAPKNGKRSETDDTPTIMNTKPVGNRIVFVVDTSLSMNLKLKIELEELTKEGPISGRRKKDKDGDKKEEEKKKKKNPLEDLPWKEIETKMDLARFELSRSIKALKGDFYFAIVTYSTEIDCITGGFVQATPGNCNRWAKTVLGLEPEALTNIHGGLMEALRCSDVGTKAKHPAVDKNCVLTGADTIIFLTDGWASWDDESDGKITDKRNKVPDSIGDGPHVYGEDIWPDIIRQNIFRKVVISTLGIGNHDKVLMKKLAKLSGGTYTDWYFDES